MAIHTFYVMSLKQLPVSVTIRIIAQVVCLQNVSHNLIGHEGLVSLAALVRRSKTLAHLFAAGKNLGIIRINGHVMTLNVYA